MYWQTALAFFIGLAAAAPAASTGASAGGPNSVKVHSVSLLGSGCPAGTAGVTVDATGQLFEATFSEYSVATGPGTTARDWRKNCKLTINMQFDSGYQFSIMETSMKGFAEIPAGAVGKCDNTFSFTGDSGTAKFALNLKGKYSAAFDLKSDPSISSWSPCGGSTAILNMNTQCNLAPTNLPALIAVDSVSGKLTVKFAIKWQPCKKKAF